MITTSLQEAKSYLRVEYSDDDTLITSAIETGEKLVTDTLRKELTATPLNKLAVLYAVAYLYEHREDANMNELLKSLRYILTTEREVAF